MDTTPIPVPSARPLALKSSPAVTRTSTIDWSKTTVTSSSGTPPCEASATSLQQHVFVVPRDELRQCLRFRITMNQSLPLVQQRVLFCQRLDILKALVLRA